MIYLPLDQLLKNQPKVVAPVPGVEPNTTPRIDPNSDASRARDRSRQ